MSSRRYLPLAAALLATSIACARLTATIQVLDTACAQIPLVPTGADAIALETDLMADITNLRAQLVTHTVKVADILVLRHTWAPADKEKFLGRVSDFIDMHLGETRQALTTAITLAAKGDGAAAWAAICRARASLGTLTAQIESVFGALSADAGARGRIEIANATEHAATEITDVSSSLRYDPAVALIAHAPEHCWDKGDYNHAYAFGQIGNTDIAIKMERTGDFTIKGLRLDATRITQATFQALTESIKFAAAASGVPVPAGQTQTGADKAAAELTSAETDEAIAARKALLSRMALIHVLDVVFDQSSNFATEKGREAALGTINGALGALDKQIAP